MDFDFTEEQLALLIPGNRNVSDWYVALCKILPKYGITTKKRVAHFISQCAHESNNFKSLEENLNYSESNLNRVFRRYFGPGKRNAAEYARNPQKLANYVYMDKYRSKGGALGNIYEGDGWLFRGRGLKQLTGRDNYASFGASIGISAEEAAEYVSTAKGAIESACWYWDSRSLNRIADSDDVARITKFINGGDIGLADRQSRYLKALSVLGEEVDLTYTGPLRRGSKGSCVAKIQQALGITADGIYGRGTERAVKKWQKQQGLVADGIVGPKTAAKLLG